MSAIVINTRYALRSDSLLLKLARGRVSIGRGDIVEVALSRGIPLVLGYGRAVAVIERGPTEAAIRSRSISGTRLRASSGTGTAQSRSCEQ